MESEGVSASGVENNGGFYKSVMKKGRYTTPWPSIPFPSFGELFKFLFCTKDNSKIPSQEMLDQTLPIMKPDFQQCAPGQGLRVTWLGHATVLVQMDGINILTDPIFSNRCAPVQFMGPKRYRRAPCTVADLPKIDLVLISHNHYDHLDYHSVQQLNARFGPELQWCVGMGLGSWMRSMNCENLIELDWWEEKQMAGHENIKIACTPSQHWCKRTATDDNKVLWASWCVLGPTQRFFFAGDTGYCSIFERIGTRYGPFNLAAIPIGAYEPRRFLACQHVDPEEAVQMHQDLKAIKSVAIHWGTFPLSYEYYLEPPQKVKEALEKRGLPEDEFYALNHGESRHQSESTTDD